MPIYDKSVLAGQARRLGFQASSFEKVSRLTEILRFLNENSLLRNNLALKGGTAINLTIFNMPRLSVDIDLDFTGKLDRVQAGERREQLNALLERYMAAQGYSQRQKSKRTHVLDSFVYSYTNAAGNIDNIKLEINYILRQHVLPTVDVTARNQEVFEPFSVRTLAPVEIFASKIVALSSRAAARDLYDLDGMVSSGIFNESDLGMLRKCAVFYRAIAGDTKTRGFQFGRMEDITPYKIKTDLAPMIRNTERFDLQAAQSRVSEFLQERMALTDNEIAFLNLFYSGKYEPQLLFDDAEIIARIQDHPMAIWRIQKIREQQELDR